MIDRRRDAVQLRQTPAAKRRASAWASATAPLATTRASVGSTSSGFAPRGDHVPHLAVALGGQDQRQRDGAVQQVGAERLAGGVGIAVAVEHVVGDLEGEAERLGESSQRVALRAVDAAEARAQHGRGREQPARS